MQSPVYVNISLFMSIYPCLCQYIPVYVNISLFMSIYPCLCQDIPVYVNMSLFMLIYPCLCQDIPVYVCLCQYIPVYVNISLFMSIYPSLSPLSVFHVASFTDALIKINFVGDYIILMILFYYLSYLCVARTKTINVSMGDFIGGYGILCLLFDCLKT